MIGAIIGVVGLGVSAYSAYKGQESADKAVSAQKDAGAEATRIAQEGLDFQMQVYEEQMQGVAELESIFGPVRENMANYYNTMSVEQYQLQGKAEIEKQYERSNENIDAMFSNNGMYSSGQRANAQVALESAREEVLGTNLQNAQDVYAGQQMNWLNYGAGEIATKHGLASGTQQQVGSALSNQANVAMTGGSQLAGLYGQQASGYGQMTSGGLQLAGYAAGGGFSGAKSLTPNTPALTSNQVQAATPGSFAGYGQYQPKQQTPSSYVTRGNDYGF